MNREVTYAEPITGDPNPAPRKKGGCGCCLGGCLTTLLVLVILLLGGGAAMWYGMKSFTIPDQVVVWSYQNVIRPKILETLPPTMKPQQKQQILQAADFGLQRYISMTPSEKRALGKEIMIALYYYSQNKIIPPDEIPNLTRFAEETQRAYLKKGP